VNGLRVLWCNYTTPKPFAFQTMWKSSLDNGQCAGRAARECYSHSALCIEYTS